MRFWRVLWLAGIAGTQLAGCQTDRLLVVSVTKGDEVSDLLAIATFEVGVSTDGFSRPRTIDTAGDASTTTFPVKLGIYLRERSGTITVVVHAYNRTHELVAGGSGDFLLTGDKVQRIDGHSIVLHRCQGPPPSSMAACPRTSAPDGGSPDTGQADASDADVGGSSDAGDAEVGDVRDSEVVADVRSGDADAESPDAESPDAEPPDAEPPDAEPPDAEPIPAGCGMYCSEVVAACPSLFAGERQCQRVCAKSGLAPADETIGEPLGCRRDQARMVATDQQLGPTVCPYASLIGASCSGAPCIVYCTAGRGICGIDSFPDVDCEVACFGFAEGQIGVDRSGDSLACRMAWLQDAVDDPTLCPNATPAPTTGPCQAQ